jgi:hypothetical protein
LLPRLLGNSQDGIWLIRRLAFDLDVTTDWDNDAIAQRWAAAVAVSLISEIEAGGSDNVLFFAGRADLLAQFVADLAENAAWGRWYYSQFEGLRHLTTSGAVRSALLDDPDDGLLALRLLSDGAMDRLVEALSPGDASLVLDGLGRSVSVSTTADCLEAVVTAYADLPTGGDDARAGLQLYIAAVRRRWELAGRTLREMALAILSLARVAAGHDGLAQRLRHGGFVELLRLAASSDAGRLLVLSDLSVEAIINAIAVLRPPPHEALSPASAAFRRQTLFGAAFLLAQLLDERDALPYMGLDEEDDRLLRMLVLVRCLGGTQAERVRYDPVVRDMLGLSPQQDAEAARELQERLARSPALMPPAEAGGYILAVVPGSRSRERRLVLIDAETGVWRRVMSYRGRRSLRPAVQGLADGTHLYVPAAMLPPLQAIAAQYKIEAVEERLSAEDAGLSPAVLECIRRLGDLPADFAYLGLPADLGGPSRVEMALDLAAQRVLRRLAAGLPGFMLSSLSYLQRNFLDFTAEVEVGDDGERWLVQLGKPPLNLVLVMTGRTRAQLELSWLPGTSLELYQ